MHRWHIFAIVLATARYVDAQCVAAASQGAGGTVTAVTTAQAIYNVHSFTAGGTFTLPQDTYVDVFMVGGGGGGGAQGQATDMAIQLQEILKMKKVLTQIYVDHNSRGKTFEEFSTMMERDTYMSAQEALDYGLIDEIIKKVP